MALRPRTSQIVRELLDGLDAEDMAVSAFLEVLRSRAFGLLILLLGVISIVPGINVVASFLIMFVAAQMIIGRQIPVVPGLIGEYRMPFRRIKAVVKRILPHLERMERFVKPRWPIATSGPVKVLTGVVLLALCFTLLIPVPFSQLLPAFAIIVIALALLERDGLAMIVGLLVSAITLFVGAIMTVATVRAVSNVIERWF